MRKITIIAFLFFLSFTQTVFSQAGEGVYQFLSKPASARIAAMGGTNVSMYNYDLSFTLHNPALLNLDMSNRLSLSATSYIADVIFGSAVYAYKLDENNYLGAGILFTDYGRFNEIDEYDTEGGRFSVLDAAIHLMYARKLAENWALGATLKPIFSSYERYSSFALAVDLGLSYHAKESQFSAGLVLKNLGAQLTSYNKEIAHRAENLPFRIEAGITQKLQHAPFRFSVTMHNLQQWDLSYTNDNLGFGENLMRHFIFNVDLVPSDNFYIALGYNYRRVREMKVLENKGLSGFSLGAGVNIKMFSIDFAIAKYHVSSNSFHLTISTDLNGFKF